MKYSNLSYWPYFFYSCFFLSQRPFIQVLQIQSLATHSNLASNFQVIGVFSNSLQFNAATQQCNHDSLRDIQFTQAMIYAVQTLTNNNSKLLPDINLGWTIFDSCSSREFATSKLASILLPNEQQKSISGICSDYFNTNNNGFSYSVNSTTTKSDQQPIIGIIGEKSDIITSALASFTSSLRYSHISYNSFSPTLNDRQLFPYFYRTSAPVNADTNIFTKIFKIFNWNLLPIVLAGNVEIVNVLPLVQSFFQTSQVCFDPIIKIYDNYTIGELKNIILQWKNRSEMQVVGLFGRETIIYNLLKQAEIHNLTGITFIGSHSWLSSSRIYTIRADIIQGSIGIAFNRSSSEQFSDYLNQLDFCNNKENPWFIKAWRQKLLQAGLDVQLMLQNCKIDNKLKQQYFGEFYDIDIISLIIMDSMLSFSYALHDALGCNNITCLQQSKVNFDRNYFNKILSKISFAGITSSNISFASNGDIELSLNIVNLQEDTFSSQYNVKPVKIGHWSKLKGLVLDEDKIIWNGNRSWFDIPSSRCSQDCSPGYYQYKDVTIASNLQSCCWKCRKCPTNHISNTTNARECILCSSFAAPNADRTSCIEFPIAYVKLDNPLSIAVLIVASFHFICLTCIWIIMITKRHTPVVKGSNFILVNVLLFFIGMCIPAAILYLLPISVAICQARMFLSTISEAGIYLTILCKTNQVSLIFKSATRRKKKQLFLTKSFNQVILICIILGVIGAVLLSLSLTIPVKVNRSVTLKKEIELICYFQNNYDTINVSVWLGLIGIMCLILAFKARLLPENFNESRYILLSSIFIVIINLCSLPATTILRGVIADSVTALVMLIFGISPLLCLFIPKIYIIYYQPELNTQQEAMASITNYTFNNFNNSHQEPYVQDRNKISPESVISKDRLLSNN